MPQKRSSPEKDDGDNLEALPPALEQLDPDDYPLARFWSQSSWIEYIKKQANQGFTPSNLGFLCDEDGVRVSKERLEAITKRAKSLWTNLHWHRRDPKSWSKKCNFVADYFARNICMSFSEFGLCENDWKAEAFGSIRYPDWTSKTRASGQLLRRSFFIQLSFDLTYLYLLFQESDPPRGRTMTQSRHPTPRGRRSKRCHLPPPPPSLTLTMTTSMLTHLSRLLQPQPQPRHRLNSLCQHPPTPLPHPHNFRHHPESQRTPRTLLQTTLTSLPVFRLRLWLQALRVVSSLQAVPSQRVVLSHRVMSGHRVMSSR